MTDIHANIHDRHVFKRVHAHYAYVCAADDYLMEKYGIISMSPEIGPEAGGFYPTADAVQKVNEENTPRTVRLLLKAGPELTTTLAAVQCKGGVSSADSYPGPHWGLTVFNRYTDRHRHKLPRTHTSPHTHHHAQTSSPRTEQLVV